MYIAICDDDKRERQRIASYLADTPHKVYLYAAMEEMLSVMASGTYFDLLLLDIEIPGRMSGLEAAKYVRSQDKDVMIVFITNHEVQVWEAFAVEVMDFLVKPIEPDKLQAVVRRCTHKYESNNRLVFSQDMADLAKTQEMISLYSKDIYYMMAQKNYVCVYHRLSDEPFRMRCSMSKLSKELQRFVNFYRCQSGYIINWQYVVRVYREKDYSGWALLKDGQWEMLIPVSRDKWQEAKSFFHQYRRGGE